MIKYYEIDTNIGIQFTNKMIILLKKAIKKRLLDTINTSSGMHNIMKDCYFMN